MSGRARPDTSDPVQRGPLGKISVIVADRDLGAGEQLGRTLEREPDIEVVAIVASADRVGAVVGDHRPDVLVLDPQLLDGDRSSLDPERRAASPRTRYILHATVVDSPPLTETDGVAAVVFKQLTARPLVDAIRRVMGRQANTDADAG